MMEFASRIRRMGAVLSVAFVLTGPGAAADPGRFALISDIHFDPFAQPALASELGPRAAAEWPAILGTSGGPAISGRGQDTNPALLSSTLSTLGAAAGDVDFVIVAGDLLAHRFDQKAAGALGTAGSAELVRSLAARTALYVGGAVGRALPGRPVVISLGNNDSDCGDYRLDPGGPFLAATRDAVRGLAGPAQLMPDFDRTFEAAGYYGLRHPTVPGAVILVVNDVLWSTEYRDACGTRGTTAADAMMDWVEARLAEAARAGERVWLVHHIPTGIDPYATLQAQAGLSCAARTRPLLREPYASRFIGLLRDHAGTIQANFSGHTHQDSYRLVTVAGVAAGVEKMAPSISPIFGNNPGFHVFDYDRPSGDLRDFSTWFLSNLDEAARGGAAAWRQEYVFTQAYAQPDYSPGSVARVADGLARSGTPAVRAFRQFYPVEHGEIGLDAMPVQVCAIGHLDVPTFAACHCGGG
ncbi:MAG: metallophosphoesterase [Microvirga sp.]